ncbi:unnamed protein product, partial [marine sediment metagenome]
MKRLEGFCKKSIQLGASKAKIIKAEEIAVADWVRLKCQYGCGGYGERLTCPPYSPTPSETRRIIAGYKRGILMKFRSCQECGDQGAVDIHKVVAEMERDLFLLGFYAAFGM